MGLRDRALLLLGFAGAFRRSELVGLDVEDLEFTPRGIRVQLRRSKTDQEAEGRPVGIPYGAIPETCPVQAVERWLEMTQPLRNTWLVILTLVANFVIVPAVALILLHVFPLDGDHEIGLVLLGVAAGAPFLPKLAEIARLDVPLAVAVMALLILASVLFLPIGLPLLLPGIQVDGANIALSLLLTILLPLGLGMFFRWQWPNNVHKLRRALAPISNICLVLLLVLLLGLNVGKVLAMFGSGSILAIVIVTVAATAAGYLLGSPQGDTRYVLAFGTGQRNMAATFIIANANFADRPQVLVMLAAASVISMLLVLPVAVMLGKQADAAASAAGPRPRSGTSVAGD